jgi:hypothetical protein
MFAFIVCAEALPATTIRAAAAVIKFVVNFVIVLSS